jgi:uncharacterized protein YkwD
VYRRWRTARIGSLLLLASIGVALMAHADGLGVVQTLRAGGCGGLGAALPPLRRNDALDHAAYLWATGHPASTAVERSGYQAERSSALHIRGADDAAMQVLRKDRCRALTDPKLRDVGYYHQGADTWLVMASAYVIPPATRSPQFSARVLELVNAARERGQVCGRRSFKPVAPLRISGVLADVARGHAADMAEHNYFDHKDLAGHSPADRVRAAGYHEQLVGENIAYGPTSAEEVVQGWLDSPGHCENIMNPRFAEMGVAYAPGHRMRQGLYWVQLLVAPHV